MNENALFLSPEMRIAASEDGKPTRIEGMAVPYNQLSLPIHTVHGQRFREKFVPGAFADSIGEAKDIRGSVGHNAHHPLGRTSKGTLQLQDRADGLYVSIAIPDTTVGRDALENVRNGNFDGMSIEFMPVDDGDTMERVSGEFIRTVHRARLLGVTLTGIPAYPQTAGTLALRSIDAILASEEAALEQTEAEKRQSIAFRNAVRLRILELEQAGKTT